MACCLVVVGARRGLGALYLLRETGASLSAYPGTRAEARCRPAGGAVAARHRWRRSSPSLTSVNWSWARAAATLKELKSGYLRVTAVTAGYCRLLGPGNRLLGPAW